MSTESVSPNLPLKRSRIARVIGRAGLLMGISAIILFSSFTYRIYRPLTHIVGQRVARLPAETGSTGPRTLGESAEQQSATPELTGTQRINILLLGSDTDAKFQGVYITQTIIVASVDPVHKKVSVLSIPRDFWVAIPDHGYQKIQSAYAFGGVASTRQVLEENFGIPIHYYAWVGLTGFVKIIDTTGGVTIDVLHPVIDDFYPDDLNTADPYTYKHLYIPAGPQHLDGRRALEYVRSRHGDAIGDFGRSIRQQQVLLELKKKLDRPRAIPQLPQYLDDLDGSVKTDMDLNQLIQFANFLKNIKSTDIDRQVLDPPLYSSLGWSPDGQQSIVIPQWDAIHHLVATMFAPLTNVAGVSSVKPSTL